MRTTESQTNKCPLVTVIIPLYNAEQYIAEAIQSILNQTYENIELLVIDDASTDNSLAEAIKFENKNVKIFTQANKGASAARNYGLREVKGEYIQFLDADDLLSSTKIEEQIKVLLENPTKIAICPTIHFFDGERISGKMASDEWYYNSFTNPCEFLIRLYGGYEDEGGMIQPNSWLTPKKIIDKAGFWDERLSLDDDGEFFCRIILASTGVVCANNAINYYRKFQNTKSLSSQTGYKAIKSALLSLQLKQKHLAEYSNELGYKKAFSRAYKRMAVQVYPEFRDVAAICIQNISELGGTTHDVTLGGAGVELVKKFFGWKAARFLQFFYKRLIRNFIGC